MEHRKFGALSSSVDPSKLSTAVSGGIIALSALLIWVGNLVGLPLTQNQIAAFATQLGLATGSLVFLYGAVRKIIVAVNHRFFVKKLEV